jgi:SPP1 family predicted phage head-tail adaptor
MTTANDLFNIIDIQHKVEVEDTLGESTVTWATLHAKLFAGAYPLRGSEFIAASQLQSEVKMRFRIRAKSGIDSTMRVVWKGLYYALVSEPLDVDGEGKYLDLYCAAGVRDGR